MADFPQPATPGTKHTPAGGQRVHYQEGLLHGRIQGVEALLEENRALAVFDDGSEAWKLLQEVDLRRDEVVKTENVVVSRERPLSRRRLKAWG